MLSKQKKSDDQTINDQTDTSGKNIPAAITDTGCERVLNEDRYAVIDSPSGTMWLVCDGMGGVAGGELAAQLAVDAIRRDLETVTTRQVSVAMKNAFGEANRVIVLRRQNQAFAQMGTTAVGAMFNGIDVSIGWVGDSRAYLIHSGTITQLTKDHTYVQELVDKGEITPEEAIDHPDGHILTRCIGAEVAVGVEFKEYWLWKNTGDIQNDILLLCTDGLYSLVTDQEILKIVLQDTPQHACARLVELAKERGGYDNITIAIIPIGGQLRTEPPANYDKKSVNSQHNRKSDSKKIRTGLSWPKTLFIVLILSCVAVILVFLVCLFYLSR